MKPGGQDSGSLGSQPIWIPASARGMEQTVVLPPGPGMLLQVSGGRQDSATRGSQGSPGPAGSLQRQRSRPLNRGQVQPRLVLHEPSLGSHGWPTEPSLHKKYTEPPEPGARTQVPLGQVSGTIRSHSGVLGSGVSRQVQLVLPEAAVKQTQPKSVAQMSAVLLQGASTRPSEQ